MSTDAERIKRRRRAHDLQVIALLLVVVTVFAAIGGALWTVGARDPSQADYVRGILVCAAIPAIAAAAVYARSRYLLHRKPDDDGP